MSPPCLITFSLTATKSHTGAMNAQVAETATQFFITADRPNVSGLVLAGSADFKTELSQSDMFDQRLQSIVLSVVDVSYGGSALLLDVCGWCFL